MRRDISYHNAITDHPAQANQIIADIKSAKSKYSNTNPQSWIWYYSWACYGIPVKGSTHDECIDYMINNIISGTSLCAQPSSRGVVRYAQVTNYVTRDWVKDYVLNHFNHIITVQNNFVSFSTFMQNAATIATQQNKDNMKINTSNDEKLAEFVKFGLTGLERTKIDVVEPDADKETIIRYKATFCGESVLVEDTSLDIDGEDVGANVKWLKNNLTPYIGKKAQFHVYIGILLNGKVFIYHGMTEGMIKEKGGDGMGFDAFFYPNDSNLSFAQDKPDSVNPRAKAVRDLIEERHEKIAEPIYSWDGPWQSE